MDAVRLEVANPMDKESYTHREKKLPLGFDEVSAVIGTKMLPPCVRRCRFCELFAEISSMMT